MSFLCFLKLTMYTSFETIRHYTQSLGLHIIEENEQKEIFIVQHEEKGISHLIIDCEKPLLILEHFLFAISKPSIKLYSMLLQSNRSLLNGSFAINKAENTILYHDSIELKNLSLNQFTTRIHSVSFAICEYGTSIIKQL